MSIMFLTKLSNSILPFTKITKEVGNLKINNGNNTKLTIKIYLKNSHSFEYQIGEKGVRK